MSNPLPLWPKSVLRVIALGMEAPIVAPLEMPTIHALARVDVVCSPVLGCGVGRLMSAVRDADAPEAFADARLRKAVLNPRRPDFLVAAHAATRDAIPAELRPGLPWIIILQAWRRLQSMVPSVLMRVCWEHGDEEPANAGPRGAAERKASFAANALRLLLRYASPEELEALSRDGVRP